MDGPLPTLPDPTYQVEARIGSGGGGTIYQAWHTQLRKYVVIKEFTSDSTRDVQTHRNEIEALKNVKSAYLPQVFGFLPDGDRFFAVMEFVEGESIDKLLAAGHVFSQPQVIKWYGQLASALETIHSKNIYHRDIKPANIMLTPSGDVCLIDFNAALVSGNDIKFTSRSLGYASPEQYEIYERCFNAQNAPFSSVSPDIGANPQSAPFSSASRDIGANPQNASFSFASPDIGANPQSAPEENHYNSKPYHTNKVSFAEQDLSGHFFIDTSTELVNPETRTSMLLPQVVNVQKTDMVAPLVTDGIDWNRSDIYSLGATMYHLLTGKRPPSQAADVIPLSKFGRFSEGIVYIVERSMQHDPMDRFESASALAKTVSNIHKHDKRWAKARSKRIAALVVLPIMFALFALTAVFGGIVMAQEKEGRYYTQVYDIENGDDPQSSYSSALAMYWDRIDPYRAMAKRLWNDGDLDACREYIERNIGNIADYKSAPDAQRSFGDIYYILGNCYYYRPGEPDYDLARGNFEIAVQFVTDNPVYYRDYAITLARTGNVAEAERMLEIASSLNLEEDSLELLRGEISYIKGEYNSAIVNFDKAISLTSDDYMRYRAYHMLDDIYKKLGKPDRSVAILSEALSRIPLNRVPEMTERLADAYIKNGDFENAIALYEQLSDNAAPQFHIMHSLVILLYNAREFERAEALLERMAYIFPDNYIVPMRQAFLEAYKQSGIENDSRDYTLTEQYYDKAVKLYGETVKQGGSDPEMQQLEAMIKQLKENGWLSEVLNNQQQEDENLFSSF